MNARTILSITILALVFCLPLGVLAQTETPSIRDSIRDKVAEELSQIREKVGKKAYLGSITAIDGVNFTLNTQKNSTRKMIVTTDTVIKLKSGKEGTPTDLKVGDFVLAMGEVNSEGLLTVKRLLVVDQPVMSKRSTTFGTVTTISPSSLTLTTNDGDSKVFKLVSDTKVTNPGEGQLTKAKLTDIKKDQKVLVVSLEKDATSLTARHVHIFKTN